MTAPGTTSGAGPAVPVLGGPSQRWLGTTGLEATGGEGTLAFTAGASTDWFRDPRTGTVVASAPVAIVVDTAAADRRLPITVSCRVEVDLTTTFDAAALFVHHDEAHWLKFALERSPDGEPTLVSVRTTGWSDDCNHEVLPTAAGSLRVALDQQVVALHWRDDGDADGPWRLLRVAPRLHERPPVIGLSVQSPLGAGTRATFTEVRVDPRRLDDPRDGS